MWEIAGTCMSDASPFFALFDHIAAVVDATNFTGLTDALAAISGMSAATVTLCCSGRARHSIFLYQGT
jgi:hypothetical protein